ncbi:hypothetical protein [Alienimonas chondri]|uniref:Uncharacterized protein n=1 Tax=Alienimonas chondri TaxID=2681879 RepID=A0ABX1VJY0_9PLAN|nr:hypothetical protein [Alienimonas chondri]NNJ27548.1 hypothetical protein [Alienimonas chondri]
MSDRLPPAADDAGELPFDDVADAALSALLTALPRSPAPRGFRDGVLAAIAVDLEEPLTEDDPVVPENSRADAPPDVALGPDAGTADPAPLWRRSLRIVGGLAVTAALLAGVALLWPPIKDGARGVATNDAAGDASARLPELAEADGATMRPGPGGPPATAIPVPELADAVAPRELMEAAPGSFGVDSPTNAPAESFGRLASLSNVVRVVRVQSVSPLSNSLAVHQFETVAMRNSIVPRNGRDKQAGFGIPPTADKGAGESAAALDIETSTTQDFQLESLPGPVGVLVVAEPAQFERTFQEFRDGLTVLPETAGAIVSDGEPLKSAEAARFLVRSELSQQSTDGVNDLGMRATNSGRGANAPSPGAPLGGISQDGNAGGGFGGATAPLDSAGLGQPADPGSRRLSALPYQMRVAPPAGSSTLYAAPPEAGSGGAAPATRDMQFEKSPAETELDSSEEERITPGEPPPDRQDDGRVPILVLFEPPPESTEPVAGESPP